MEIKPEGKPDISEYQEARIEDLKSQIQGLNNQLHIKDEQIKDQSENMHKQAVHIQSLIQENTVLHQLDQKIIYPHYDFKHLTEKYFEIGMKLDDFLIQLVKY